MDKRFCETCKHFLLADQHGTYSEQVQYAKCAKFKKANEFANVSLAFATEQPMYCYLARDYPNYCGPEAKGYEEKAS